MKKKHYNVIDIANLNSKSCFCLFVCATDDLNQKKKQQTMKMTDKLCNFIAPCPLSNTFYHNSSQRKPNLFPIEQYKAQVNVGDCQGPER